MYHQICATNKVYHKKNKPQSKFGRNRRKITTFIVYQPKRVMDGQTEPIAISPSVTHNWGYNKLQSFIYVVIQVNLTLHLIKFTCHNPL